MMSETHFPLESRITWRPGVLACVAAGAIVLGFLITYWPTVQSIEAIWRRAETFAHGYVVIPIALWLTWCKRDVLAAMSPKPFWPAIAAIAAFGFAWLLGSVAGVLGLEQFALLFMIIAAIVAVVGVPITKEIAFPLVFLVFAVPFGEFIVPWLIDHTADFTIAAVRASGVPVFREGNHFAIPTGRWSVVEACSGIRYLLASLTVGTLYAYLTYRSPRKRALFIAVSIVVPIIANWLRAYMIVMIGHLSGNTLAVGVDHIIYGWIFFGVVIMIMFWIGSFWREDEAVPDTASVAHPVGLTAGSPRISAIILAVCAALVAGASWRPLATALETVTNQAAKEVPAVMATAGWKPAAELKPVWTPSYTGDYKSLHQWFTKEEQIVGLYVALYSNQTQGNELIGSQNALVKPNDNIWVKTSEGQRSADWDGAALSVRTAEIVGGPARRLARSWYWVDGRFTSSDTMAKVMLAIAKVTLRPDHSAVIVIYTPISGPPAQADATLDTFSRDMAPGVMKALQAATAHGASDSVR